MTQTEYARFTYISSSPSNLLKDGSLEDIVKYQETLQKIAKRDRNVGVGLFHAVYRSRNQFYIYVESEDVNRLEAVIRDIFSKLGIPDTIGRPPAPNKFMEILMYTSAAMSDPKTSSKSGFEIIKRYLEERGITKFYEHRTGWVTPKREYKAE